jgi:hypothetical protein
MPRSRSRRGSSRRLVTAARRANEPELRVRLAELLGATGGPGVAAGAVAVLSEFLRSGDPRLQRAAVNSLSGLSTPEAMRLMDDYYRDRHRGEAS